MVVLLVFKRDGDERREVLESGVALGEFVVSVVVESDVSHEELLCFAADRYVEVFAATHCKEEGADSEVGHCLTQSVVFLFAGVA